MGTFSASWIRPSAPAWLRERFTANHIYMKNGQWKMRVRGVDLPYSFESIRQIQDLANGGRFK
jgi:hypothetical protein